MGTSSPCECLNWHEARGAPDQSVRFHEKAVADVRFEPVMNTMACVGCPCRVHGPDLPLLHIVVVFCFYCCTHVRMGMHHPNSLSGVSDGGLGAVGAPLLETLLPAWAQPG
eukprot:scaffold1706_cov113-Isochrysis_galbana.AAC.2